MAGADDFVGIVRRGVNIRAGGAASEAQRPLDRQGIIRWVTKAVANRTATHYPRPNESLVKWLQ